MAKILIVDDSRTSRRMLRNILVENGHEVIGEAENGQIGFEKYIELKPDIVTLDITMPVLDGLGALEKIIACDEIGSLADAKALEYALHSGVSLITAVHSSSFDEAKNKPGIAALLREKAFAFTAILDPISRNYKVMKID